MKFNKTLLLTLLALPMTACAANDGLLSNYGANRPAWLNKLQQLNNTSDGKFRIIQVGDSHTAGDLFHRPPASPFATTMGQRRYRLGLS